MRILRTTERYEAGWREQNFIPHDEDLREIKARFYAGLRAFQSRKKRFIHQKYIKFTSRYVAIWNHME